MFMGSLLVGTCGLACGCWLGRTLALARFAKIVGKFDKRRVLTASNCSLACPVPFPESFLETSLECKGTVMIS